MCTVPGTQRIVQGLLAAFFGAGGVVKLIQPPKRLYDQGLTWVEDFSPAAVKAIGGLELAAAASHRCWCRWPPSGSGC